MFIGRYRKWEDAVITVNFYGSLSYSCYFSAVVATTIAVVAVAVTMDAVANL